MGPSDWPDTWRWLRESTLCPFASTAKVLVTPAWVREDGDDTNAVRIFGALREFCRSYHVLRLHGAAFEVYLPRPDSLSLERCTARFRWIVSQLMVLDGQDPERVFDDVLNPEWQFTLDGRRLFLNLFGPCYPEVHTKHLPPGDHIVVFAQPEESFDYCGVNAGSHSVKTAIRTRFARAGRPYPGDLIDKRIEAHLYVFPGSTDDPPIEWWRMR